MPANIEDSIVIGRRTKYFLQRLRNKQSPPQHPYTTSKTVNCYVAPEVRQLKELLADFSQSLSENRENAPAPVSTLPFTVLDAIEFCREGETLEDQEANNDYELATLLLIAGWDFGKVAIAIARTQEQEDDDLTKGCFDYGENVARIVYKKNFVREAMAAMILWKSENSIPINEIDPEKLELGDYC